MVDGQEIKDGKTYGCHIDLLDGDEPDGCVLDYGAPDDCTMGRTPSGRARRSKWTCKYWKDVKHQ